MKTSADNLNIPIEKLRGVSAKIVKPLKHLGIETIYDLLAHLPFRYDDFSHRVVISALRPETVATIRAQIDSVNNQRSWKKGIMITTALVSDATGNISAVWFNQPFLAKTLRTGRTVYLSGKVVYENGRLFFQNPAYEAIVQKNEPVHTARLVPIYRETRGITSRWLRYLAHNALPFLTRLGDALPQEIAKQRGLMPLAEALRRAHFPRSLEEARLAKKRLAFDELFFIQLFLLRNRAAIKTLPAPQIRVDVAAVKKLLATLPFILTDAQRKAAWEILKDMEKGAPMNRLLEGDVGSGKTVVAAIGALNASLAGWQTAVMAPTEVLAHQHFATFSKLLAHENISVSLLTGKTAIVFDPEIKTEYRPKKPEVVKMIKEGRVAVAIGTHALIQENITFKNLGLIVLDEQHRFGVNQRAALAQKSIPHFLSMTATPIPRTLALTAYGDLDISILNEMPANRKKIITQIIAPAERDGAYQFVREEIQKGRQVFVICPRIESQINADNTPIDADNQRESAFYQHRSALNEVKAVKEEYEKLSKHIFPDLAIAMLHGKMKSKEKEKIIGKFKEKRFDILVSTSVIEVGIDIPNASVMMIEGAERFGLAQLHQFRGRVGRSDHQSYCLMFSETNSVDARRRLRALLECENGFELAEKDLEIRGPGDFFGTRQSGLPDLAMASLGDMELIKSAREEAKKLIKEDAQLSRYPKLKERLQKLTTEIHFE